MLADFFTKPLQGNLFRRFRDVVLGYKHVDTLSVAAAPSSEERVGEVRTDSRDNESPGVVEGSMTHPEVTSKSKITWASVVRGHTKATITKRVKGKDAVVSRLLSRNNPV